MENRRVIPEWDLYFLRIAKAAAQKSKDPSTKVGCAISVNKRPPAIGFNGFPSGVPDLPEDLENRTRKLRLTLHAELNAILFSDQDLTGGTCYVYPIPPCAQCAAALAQKGITRIVSFLPDPATLERWAPDWEIAEWIYTQKKITIDLFPKDLMELL